MTGLLGTAKGGACVRLPLPGLPNACNRQPPTAGPQARLDDTAVAQPALFVAGLAAVEMLRARDPAAVDGCVAAAGLSLGEYTALVFAGALGFEEGLRVGVY